ncbi:MAG TPA: acetyl-CoA carboxylase biotin carboxyl carrier protein [Pyrinomonadaceae bacterium]
MLNILKPEQKIIAGLPGVEYMSDQAATAPQPESEESSQSSSNSNSQQRPQEGARGSRPRHRRRHQSQTPQSQSQQQRNPEPAINMDELRELMELIDSHGFTDFELEREGFRIRLGRNVSGPASVSGSTTADAAGPRTQTPASQETALGQSTQPLTTPHPGAQAQAAASVDEGLHIITSPILGTFFRSPSPTSEPFVRIGSLVEHDTVVCIIEAMKLMNEIQAEVSGEVTKIYVENGQPVEYGQPLFGIKMK